MASMREMLLGGAAAGVGFVLGAGGALASSRRLRPLMKQAMKGYIVASDRAKEASALMAESLEDMYAEAKAEHQAETAPAPAATTPTQSVPATIQTIGR
jgi:hypothetical protein